VWKRFVEGKVPLVVPTIQEMGCNIYGSDNKENAMPRNINVVKVLEGQGILTTANYWDCECHENFIHPKSQVKCNKCGTFSECQPDSMVSEVLAAGFVLGE
jgi:hypothetical protein